MPAATSSTSSVGCSRNDSSVVRARVASIDNSDHAYTDITAIPRAAARVELRPLTTSHSVPARHMTPSRVASSIGKVSCAPDIGR